VQIASATLLMMNIIMMTMSHEGQDGYFSYFLSIQNDVFFGIMCFETILQFIGWGPMLFVFDPGRISDTFPSQKSVEICPTALPFQIDSCFNPDPLTPMIFSSQLV
jgi:hypothetical protein